MRVTSGTTERDAIIKLELRARNSFHNSSVQSFLYTAGNLPDEMMMQGYTLMQKLPQTGPPVQRLFFPTTCPKTRTSLKQSYSWYTNIKQAANPIKQKTSPCRRVLCSSLTAGTFSNLINPGKTKSVLPYALTKSDQKCIPL